MRGSCRAMPHPHDGRPVRTGGVAGVGERWHRRASRRHRRSRPSPPLKAGIIGLDTSHVVAFTQLLNAAKPKPELAGVRVVAAYPGGSPDIPSSRDRVAGYHPRPEGEVRGRDRRLDRRAAGEGRRRAAGERRRPAAPRAGAARLQGPQAGVHRQAGRRLAGRRHRHLRPGPGDQDPVLLQLVAPLQPGHRRAGARPQARRDRRLRHLRPLRARGASPRPLLVRRPRRREPLHDHGHRLRVGRPHAHRRDATWPSASGRTAGSGRSAASARSTTSSAATVFGTKGIAPLGDYGGYEPLVVEIVKFFKTGKPPVTAEETIEIFAFMEAADESKRQGGPAGDHRERHEQGPRSMRAKSGPRGRGLHEPNASPSHERCLDGRRDVDRATADPAAPTRVRYGVLAFLAAMTFVLYLDRTCIGQAAAGDPARAETHRVGQVDHPERVRRWPMRSSRSRRAGGATATGRGAS